MTGRLAAARAVGRVLRSGAYSNRVIAAEAAALDSDETRTAHRIGYGTLRWLLRIDRTLDTFSSRRLDQIQPAVLDVLRIATWEIVFGKVANAIAVDEAVKTVRLAGHARAAGFVNAMLRAVAANGEPRFDDRALAASIPSPLLEVLDRQWGPDRTDAFLAASNQDAPLTMRMRPSTAAVDPNLSQVPGIEDAWTGGSVPDGWVVQDAASTAVGWAVDPDPGDATLDMAAAPGGKTLHLIDQRANVVAMDIHAGRLRRAAKRLKGESVQWVRADGRTAPFADGTFDRVLLDAPCSGLGVMRRRPEIKYRVTPGGLEHLARRQRAMLDEAERVTARGGLVVYSVCTVTERETSGIVGSTYRPPAGLPGELSSTGLLLAPDTTGTDGMFIATARAS